VIFYAFVFVLLNTMNDFIWLQKYGLMIRIIISDIQSAFEMFPTPHNVGSGLYRLQFTRGPFLVSDSQLPLPREMEKMRIKAFVIDVGEPLEMGYRILRGILIP
jgi:hypothetical protein